MKIGDSSWCTNTPNPTMNFIQAKVQRIDVELQYLSKVPGDEKFK